MKKVLITVAAVLLAYLVGIASNILTVIKVTNRAYDIAEFEIWPFYKTRKAKHGGSIVSFNVIIPFIIIVKFGWNGTDSSGSPDLPSVARMYNFYGWYKIQSK